LGTCLSILLVLMQGTEPLIDALPSVGPRNPRRIGNATSNKESALSLGRYLNVYWTAIPELLADHCPIFSLLRLQRQPGKLL
jgi:hypothetical protein